MPNTRVLETRGHATRGSSFSPVGCPLSIFVVAGRRNQRPVEVYINCKNEGKKNHWQCLFSRLDLDFVLCWLDYWCGYHHRENAGSRLFTEVKLCWTGLISGWVTIWIKYRVLYFLGSQAGVVKTSITPSTSTTNVVCGSSFSRSQPDFEGFLRALRFPPSAKSTPSLFRLAI